jgi:hypothetical protein
MDMGILQSLELVEEMQQTSMDGSNYFVLTAKHTSSLPDISGFTSYTDVMEKSEPVVLELAATYLCFRESGSEHFDALERLRRKKGDKCEEGREEKALSLLRSFKLPSGAKDARYGNRRQIR